MLMWVPALVSDWYKDSHLATDWVKFGACRRAIRGRHFEWRKRARIP